MRGAVQPALSGRLAGVTDQLPLTSAVALSVWPPITTVTVLPGSVVPPMVGGSSE